MFIKTPEQDTEKSPEDLPGQAVAKHKENKLVDALSLYLQSIKANEAQPEWIYGNSITLSAQINRFDIGISLKEKAEKLYPKNDEISRAIALLYDKQNQSENAIKFYQKSVDLNPLQPEWVYIKLFNLLVEAKHLEQATEIKKKGLIQFPQSTTFQSALLSHPAEDSSKVIFSETNQNKTDLQDKSKSTALPVRATPQSIEHNVDLNVGTIRRQLMDSSIVERYEILLEQMLYHVNQGVKKMNPEALVHCLAEMKTDIHYLKTKLLDPPASLVDPQAKQNVNIEKIVNSTPPIPIKCELKNRIVGSGWHGAEKHGRWTGSGTLSSLVLPYPTAGKYRLEMIVKAEAKKGLLKTLKININNQPLAISNTQENDSFPAVIQAEIMIEAQNQSFLSVDLMIDETVNPQASDTRLIGLLIEQISLIPLFSQ
jgi:tetratricopeptide (TPR) repeat protein